MDTEIKMSWTLVIRANDGWHSSESFATLGDLVTKYGEYIASHPREYKIYGNKTI